MPARRQGWTVVEFVIAVALAMLLTLLASALLIATAGNYRHHSESMWVGDGGRYALEIMSQAIRQGAYVNWDSEAAPVDLAAEVSAAIGGWDARSVSKTSEGIAVPLAGVANGSDVLALRFSGSGDGASGDGSSVNCGGFGVSSPADEGARGWSIFYVALDDNGAAELRCKYRGNGGWGADAIVRGVDSFQVLYGVDTDAVADGVPNRYLNATAIRAMDDALVLEGETADEVQRDFNRKTHWKRVCSVKLALLLHGENNTRADRTPARFDLFGRSYSDGNGQDLGVAMLESALPEDQRWRTRRMFAVTIALRNRSG